MRESSNVSNRRPMRKTRLARVDTRSPESRILLNNKEILENWKAELRHRLGSISAEHYEV